MPAVIRVAIADDHAPIRSALRRFFSFEADMHWAGEACDGVEALALVCSVVVDVLLLDLSMPRMSGWEALPKLRAAAPHTRVLILSSQVDPWVTQKALAKGAAACVHKDVEPSVIVATVRRVALA